VHIAKKLRVRLDAELPELPAGHLPSGKPARRPHARVLIADDESAVRAMMGEVLGALGYDVELSHGGIHAIEVLNRQAFDLVITDLLMPRGDGQALLESIRQQHPNLPVIVVSAVQELSVVIDVMRLGAYDYMVKPFDARQLKGSVERALAHRDALRKSQDYQHNLENVVRARTEMLRQAMVELEQSYDVTLEALGDALDLKDSETEGHSKRVTAYTIALARAMGLTPGEIKTIARGAFLHDIGKMAIPDSILRKPGRLTPEEQVIMREHCTRGYHILRKIPFLAAAASIVNSHQEHFDGRGYPQGLRGDEIPVGARIFAVADALDAITSDRPYRQAQSFEAARAEIIRCSGTQFDPKIVDIFLNVPIALWQELRNEILGQNRRLLSVEFGNLPDALEKMSSPPPLQS